MTPEDRVLDPKTLAHTSLLVYRLVREKYADLSGAGAALDPGRWNKAGEKAIYTSTEIGVTLLERLAHSRKEIIPSNLAMMNIRLHGDWALDAVRMIDQNDGVISSFSHSLVRQKVFPRPSGIYRI